MPSLSLIPFVGFTNKVLGKVHIIDLSFKIGCAIGKEGYDLCTLGILFGFIGFLTFFEGDILFSFRVDSEGLDDWILCSDVKLKQSPAGLTSSYKSDIPVSSHLVVLTLELIYGSV